MKYVIYTGVLFMPDKNAASQRAQAFAKMIKNLGYTPIIIGMSNEITTENILETEKKDDDYILYEMKYPKNNSSWLKMLINIKEITKIIEYYGRANIKAIIMMDYFSVALYRINKYCKNNNIKIIADTVDWFEKSNYNFPKNIIKNLDTVFRMKLIYKKMNQMIVISKFLYDYYYKDKKIVMIPGVVIEKKILSTDWKAEEKIKLSFVGSPGNRFEKEKIDWILKALEKIDPNGEKIKFFIAGIDKKILKENSLKIVNEKFFNKGVVALGKISHKKCIELIESSDFSVIIREDTLLSRAGFPTKLGESFSCGTPVFVTPTSNIKDFILKDYGIVSLNCTEKEVEKSLMEILNLTKNRREQMHKVVREYNPLSWNKFLTEFNEILN